MIILTSYMNIYNLLYTILHYIKIYFNYKSIVFFLRYWNILSFIFKNGTCYCTSLLIKLLYLTKYYLIFQIKQLSRVVSHDLKMSCIRLMRQIFSNELAMEYSWYGAKKKEVFSNLQLCKIIMCKIIRNYNSLFSIIYHRNSFISIKTLFTYISIILSLVTEIKNIFVQYI